MLLTPLILRIKITVLQTKDGYPPVQKRFFCT
nr:MAG TPA: hypothetical protein [Bacteriophage sp.]